MKWKNKNKVNRNKNGRKIGSNLSVILIHRNELKPLWKAEIIKMKHKI